LVSRRRAAEAVARQKDVELAATREAMEADIARRKARAGKEVYIDIDAYRYMYRYRYIRLI